MSLIVERIKKSIEVKNLIIENNSILNNIDNIVNDIVNTYKNNGKVLFCGNGGSASDAQHLAAELSGRFYFDRPPLFAEALHVNTSYITAVANDYSYDVVYSRLVKAFGKAGDILIAFSTSGNSKNIVEAVKEANNIGMITIGFTGEKGGLLKDICKYLINVPSNDTPRIQESHIMIGHIICEMVENKIFK